MTLAPPFTPVTRVDAALQERGFAVLAPAALAELLGSPLAALDAWRARWDDLPLDDYLRDAGRYRRRRHACFRVCGTEVQRTRHRAHWQSVAYNALHGGIERWFEPMDGAWTGEPLWNRLLAVLAQRASALRGERPWFVEAHPFRIDTTGGIGRPTPEGAHRDGVDLVAVILVSRQDVKGGETRVFEANTPAGLRFTMVDPWSTLLLDDVRMVHESTPIQPLGTAGGRRDTLVLTFRAGGFQQETPSDGSEIVPDELSAAAASSGDRAK
jgi:hypothetical protein